MHNEFTAIIEKDKEWYIAYCAQIPGANGQGKTKEDCLKSLSEAIELILNDQRMDSLRGIPENLIKNSHIQIGEEVDITVHVGKIISEPRNKIHGRYDINDLANKMPNEYKTKEEDWGVPVGREAL